MVPILLFWVAPILAGFVFNFIGKKARGRNARSAFRFAGWGSWLILLMNLAWLGPIPIGIPIISLLNIVIWLIPSGICFLMAANSMLKEMRAQREGEFTEAA